MSAGSHEGFNSNPDQGGSRQQKQESTMVKSEVTVKMESSSSSYSAMYEVKEVDSTGVWSKEGVLRGCMPQETSNGSPSPKKNQEENGHHSYTAAVKKEEPFLSTMLSNGALPDLVDEKKPTSNGEAEIHSQVERVADPSAYLNFEMEEDKKVKAEVYDDNQSSRSSSPEASTSALKDESEEPETPSRKPGLPVSIAHLPIATKEALSTFEVLEQCVYQNKQMGLAHQQEDSMTCDCNFDPDTDDPDMACGESSDCINRLTQVECLAGDCRCQGYCRNQRFQKRQYAPIDIVKTEKKGYGVRAREDLEKDAFVYEYIGEIIGEKAFQKRMASYFDEGIEHFYFMMLQRDEFLDATKRGGKGRFLNHSCAPNCYVSKWTVGRRLRMGIFTKRRILANEELTFNYNVDRYGHDAQECFCGEPNCVGFIGGKTQTDIAGMDDLYLDALGITEAVDALGLKGSKKKKSRKLDEDYFPDLTAIPLPDVPKVSSALRQASSNRRIISKLLERILLTEDVAVQRALLRLHGFSLMSTLLHEYPEDTEINVSVINVLSKWPLITRNKLISTNIEPTVMKLAERADEPAVSEPAKLLLQMWQALEVGYRIPKSMQETIDAEGDSRKRPAQDMLEDLFVRRNRLRLADEEPRGFSSTPADIAEALEKAMARQSGAVRKPRAKTPPPLPANWELLPPPRNAAFQPPAYLCLLTKAVYEEFPSPEIVQHELDKYNRSLQVDVSGIIAQARAEARRKAEMEASAAQAEEEAARLAKKLKQEQRLKKESESKEKKMYRLFSTVVIKTMSKYKKYIDNEQFKKRAKEVCKIMCEKEKKSSHFASDKYDSLSPEKESKLKKYVKDFMTKLLARKGIKVSSSGGSSSGMHSHDKRKAAKENGHHKHSSRAPTELHSPSRMSLPTPETPSNEAEHDDNDMDLEDDEDDDLINELVDGAGDESVVVA